MTKFVSHRELSKINWGRQVEEGSNSSSEDIRTGCLLRIADGVDEMAKNVVALQRNHDYFKRRYEEEQACARRLVRSNAALRGVIKRMKAGR